METMTLREKINRNIALIEDDTFLNAINLILESKTLNQKYFLSDYQLGRIVESDNEERLGQLISNEDLQTEIDQWLSMK